MKRILFFALSLILLVSCGKDSYKIKGSVEGLEDGAVITLNVIEFNSLTELDSTVVKGGKFSFKGETDTAQVAVITFNVDGRMGGAEFFLERGTTEIIIDAENGEQRLGGTPNNDAFQKFFDDTQSLNDEADELEDKIRITLAAQGDCSDLYSQMDDLQDRFKTLLVKSIEDNADMLYGYQQLIENYSLYEPDEVMALLEKLAPTFGTDIVFLQLTAMINAQLKTSLGHPYIDFEASFLDKKGTYDSKVKLSDYISKNKVVLLDFWASWCTPCMNEVPNLKSAYKNFKSKGFEIVSVSVDEDTEEWRKAIKENGMNWVHLWNGLEDLEASPAVDYSVSAIPCTFLIDADGTIIGRNLRGEELENALEDYFTRILK